MKYHLVMALKGKSLLLISSLTMLIFNTVGERVFAQGGSCMSLYSEVTSPRFSKKPELPAFIANLPKDLLQLQLNETRYLSAREVKSLNQKTLENIESYIPVLQGERAGNLSFAEAQSLLRFIEDHPVAARQFKEKYQAEDVDIGYCFGRAAIVHWALLKMGLQKNSILKIWSVGPQANSAGKENWGFHVAAMVFVKGYGWMTIDTSTFKVEPVRHWVSGNLDRSLDNKMRIYVSSADRFGTNVPKYSRLELGLDMAREKDWYKHFFVDAISDLSSKTLEQMGLKRIKITDQPAQKPIKENAWTSVKRFFWE